MTKSDTERYHVAELEKAISMIRLDLDHLTAGESWKLQADLYEFVGGIEIGGIKLGQAVPVDKLKPEEFLEFERVPAHYIPEIIADLKKILVGIADQPASFFFHAKITDGKLTAFADPTSPFKLSWVMNPSEGARFALSYHLAGSGLTGNRIRLCPLKTCRNVFLLTRYARADRLHFCSNRCARNAATLRYREKQSKQKKKKRGKKRRKK
jgi:hypothetical protein